MEFKEELKNYQKTINSEMEKYLRRENCLEKTLNESMEYSLMAGGKRLRPILLMATYQLFKQDTERCIPYSVAIEMVHNFSLIHDDLPGIDNDDFRHGKPTNHKQFNEATAILAGDGLLNNAYSVISRELSNSNVYELPKKIRVFDEFTYAIDRLIAGEYVDTEFEGKQITDNDLKYIHENKTGAMLKLSVRTGAILADCTDEELQKLTRYSEKIGLAFQIKDDILSEVGDEKITGKPVGNDRKLEKCTYVSKYGVEQSEEILEKITKDAVECLNGFGEKAEFLRELAFYIKDRNK